MCSPVPCIRNVEDLMIYFKCDRYVNWTFNADFSTFTFDTRTNFNRKDLLSKALYYTIELRNDTSISSAGKKKSFTHDDQCCNVSDEGCHVYIVASNPIFCILFPEAINHLALLHKHIYKFTLNSYVTQYCWKPLPFCGKEDVDHILGQFSTKVHAAIIYI